MPVTPLAIIGIRSGMGRRALSPVADPLGLSDPTAAPKRFQVDSPSRSHRIFFLPLLQLAQSMYDACNPPDNAGPTRP